MPVIEELFEELQIDFTANLNRKDLKNSPYFVVAIEKYNCWPEAEDKKSLGEYINIYGVPNWSTRIQPLWRFYIEGLYQSMENKK